MDNVVLITFGFEDNKAHLILELYGKGNLILTDKKMGNDNINTVINFHPHTNQLLLQFSLN